MRASFFMRFGTVVSPMPISRSVTSISLKNSSTTSCAMARNAGPPALARCWNSHTCSAIIS